MELCSGTFGKQTKNNNLLGPLVELEILMGKTHLYTVNVS
jgi:hypothetical protein